MDLTDPNSPIVKIILIAGLLSLLALMIKRWRDMKRQ